MNYYYLKKIFFPSLFTSFLSFTLLNRSDLSRVESHFKIADVLNLVQNKILGNNTLFEMIGTCALKINLAHQVL
jgi:hypothetical protein